jgi:[ribosomal protein S5]-alanine N-acetyltransferase
MSGMTDGPARLRDWSPADGAWYVAQLSDPDIQRFTTEQPTTTADDFRSALERLNRRADQAGFAIVDAISGELAGNMAADRLDADTADVSYWIAPAFRGRGLASHAIRQMRNWVADNWQVRRIDLWTHAENIASQHAAENAGFHHEPERDEIKTIGGQPWPARWYSCTVEPDSNRRGHRPHLCGRKSRCPPPEPAVGGSNQFAIAAPIPKDPLLTSARAEGRANPSWEGQRA